MHISNIPSRKSEVFLDFALQLAYTRAFTGRLFFGGYTRIYFQCSARNDVCLILQRFVFARWSPPAAHDLFCTRPNPAMP